MAKKKPIAEGDNAAAVAEDERVQDSSTEQQPGSIGEPIEVNKVYTLAQFIAALGMDKRTVQNYVDAGLAVRRVKGRKTVFVMGQDWLSFLAQEEYLSKDIDELSEETTPLGQLADFAFKTSKQVQQLEDSAVDTEYYRSEVQGLMTTTDQFDDRLARLEEDFEELLRTVKATAEKP